MLKYIHQLLYSGSQNYNQPLTLPNCYQKDNTSIDHDYFLMFLLFNHRKELRISQFNQLLETMNTTSQLRNTLTRGVKQFNNNDPHYVIKKKPYTNIITRQQQIGLNQFLRGRIRHKLTEKMTEYYHKESKNAHQFTSIS